MARDRSQSALVALTWAAERHKAPLRV
jgi:hypothetical protein